MNLLLVAWLVGCTSGPTPQRYEVVRGDTLGKIAQRYDVTVDELRSWNGIQGDLIEVGQVLIVHGTEVVPPPDGVSTTSPKRAPRPAKGGSGDTPGPQGLSMPRPKACLSGPTDAGGERGMAASLGLSPAAARAAVDAVLPHTSHCVQGEVPRGSLMVELTVGCDGRVRRARVADDAGWPDEVAACVTDVLRHAAFPAHDLPDGETFVQPVSFGP